jgi:hypothetical protein
MKDPRYHTRHHPPAGHARREPFPLRTFCHVILGVELVAAAALDVI